MLISGKDLAARLKASMAEKNAALVSAYGRAPHLSVILVGDNPASVSYVTGKAKACETVGITNSTIRLSSDTTESQLLAIIKELNEDEGVDGILVQLPLPGQIDTDKVIDAIAVEKDVDGFSPSNVAALWQKRPGTVACTPKGIMKLLQEAGETFDGKHAVVVGRSNIVGLPVAKLLLDANATVTIAHSHTKDLASVTKEADILVVAAGKPRMISADMVKPDAVVIDVGISRNPDTGKLCGDVDTEEVEKVARCITPVPGGVGPMTIACLLENTIEAFEKKMSLL